jgi:hypothetical protein
MSRRWISPEASSVYYNSPDPIRPELSDPGLTYGAEGGACWVMIFSWLGLNFQNSSSHEEGLETSEERFAGMVLAALTDLAIILIQGLQEFQQ